MKIRTPPGLLPCGRREKDPLEPATSLGYADCQTLVLVLTFIAYALFHAARKPPSIVKSVMHPDLALALVYKDTAFTSQAQAQLNSSSSLAPSPNTPAANMTELDRAAAEAGWAPFAGKAGLELLGEVDLVFLSTYAFAMFFFGHMGDRVDLRLLLSAGMLLTGAMTSLFGAAYFLHIHSLSFFLLISSLCGLAQASGWPCVVAVMANWYGRKGRGLVFGIWNSHTSLGNIMGALASSVALEDGWGSAFIVPGVAIMIGGIVVFLFLPASPLAMGFRSTVQAQEDLAGNGPSSAQPSSRARDAADNAELEPFSPGTASGPASGSAPDGADGRGSGDTQADHDVSTYDDDTAGLLEELELGGLSKRGSKKRQGNPEDARPIGFVEAWFIPGVAAFAFCLFFAKLVAYTFLYWLPFYISHTEIEGHHLSVAQAGITSAVFDIGGVLGGIVAGHLSDTLSARATVSVAFLALVTPALGAYVWLGGTSLWANVCLLAVVGFLVNGPYALITCAVSADLGQHPSLEGNARALSTVTAIIDGTGSVGAAIGPFLTGLVSDAGGSVGWALVFVMLCSSTVLAVACISHLALAEMQLIAESWQKPSSITSEVAARRRLASGLDTT